MPVPYCGAPPAPDELFARWNLDPLLILALFALLGCYFLGATRIGELRTNRTLAFVGGWSIAAFAFVSPLCALSVSLFAARISQHMILVLAAAPLIAIARPLRVYSSLIRGAPVIAKANNQHGTLGAAGLFAIALWYWHIPGPYGATFASPVVYWLMHATVLASAIWLWDALLNGSAGVAQAGASAATMIQMSLLGALITLAPAALFAPHFATAPLWALTPLEDQQLGGAIMWVFGGAPFLALSLAGLHRLITGTPERVPAR